MRYHRRAGDFGIAFIGLIDVLGCRAQVDYAIDVVGRGEGGSVGGRGVVRARAAVEEAGTERRCGEESVDCETYVAEVED